MDITKTMVAGWDERYHSLSQKELERRLNATKIAMDAAGVDVLMAVNMVKQGFYQWFMGAGISERPTEEILIIPRQGQMILCTTSECFTDEQQKNYRKLAAVNSQDKRYGAAVNVPAFYYHYVLDELTDTKRLGVINPDFLRRTVKEYLDTYIPGLEMVDMTETMETIKAVKSPEEQSCLKAAAAFCDRLFASLGVIVRPYRLEPDMVRELRYRAYQMGSGGEDVTRNVMVDLTSSPDGGPAFPEPVLYPGRQVMPGDRINILVRSITYDEYYGALGRCFILGKAGEETKHYWNMALKAQETAAAHLIPGNTISDANSAMNDYLKSQNVRPDTHVCIYGLGYRPDEAPCRFAKSQNMKLKAGMVLCVAPRIIVDGRDPWCAADMYEITENGARKLTQTSSRLVEIDIG